MNYEAQGQAKMQALQYSAAKADFVAASELLLELVKQIKKPATIEALKAKIVTLLKNASSSARPQ